MKKLAMVMLCLTGCVSTAETVRDNRPFYKATTQKTPQQVIECVAPKWANTYGAPTIIPASDGISLIVRSGIENEFLLDVKNNGSVTLHKIFKFWFGIDNRMKAVVESCV